MKAAEYKLTDFQYDELIELLSNNKDCILVFDQIDEKHFIILNTPHFIYLSKTSQTTNKEAEKLKCKYITFCERVDNLLYPQTKIKGEFVLSFRKPIQNFLQQPELSPEIFKFFLYNILEEI